MQQHHAGVWSVLTVAALSIAPLGCPFAPRDHSACCEKPAEDCRISECIEGECVISYATTGRCGVDSTLECNAKGECICERHDQCSATSCQTANCDAGVCKPLAKGRGEACTNEDGACDGQGQCKSAIGHTCKSDKECFNDHCSDGFCCDAACDGQCMGCKKELTGEKNGHCAPTMPNLPDDADAAPDCRAKGGCGMNGLCACEDGVLTIGPSGTGADRESDIDCGGVCGATCQIGNKCERLEDCASGRQCVDGVCCDTGFQGCEGACESCNQKGSEGRCVLLKPNTKGECPDGYACDPGGLCQVASGYPCTDEANDNECATNQCYCATNQCDENAPAKCVSCEMVGCDDTNVCFGKYSGNSFCGDYKALGKPCFFNDECGDDLPYCVDGVCCGKECNGTCMACNEAYTGKTNGICAPVVLGYDPQDECAGTGAANWCSGDDVGSDTSSCGQP